MFLNALVLALAAFVSRLVTDPRDVPTLGALYQAALMGGLALTGYLRYKLGIEYDPRSDFQDGGS